MLNIQRACEASIDLAMHIVAEKKLGLPQTSRESFDFLEKAGVVNQETAKSLKAMVEFRNIAVHDYQKLNLEILQKIVEQHLSDFIQFTKQVLYYNG